MGRPCSGEGSRNFRPSQVTKPATHCKDYHKNGSSHKGLQGLVAKFTKARENSRKAPANPKEMVDWLQNRRCSARKKGAPKEIERLSDKESFSGRTPTTITPPSEDIVLATPVTPPAGEFDINAVEFEAKSSKDGAWYDVQTFLDHRIFESGPEVRVRFAGYGPEDDEWVDVRTAVRQRSVGCEETDCISIFPGDMILCYLEGTNQALFYDACVIEVERRKHDIRGCRCRFLVQYVHNGAMGVLPLSKLCRRPENVYADTKPLDNASAVVAKGTK